MCSKKLGLRVGEVAKVVPFNNFKIFGDGSKHGVKNNSEVSNKMAQDNTGKKFRVICLDVWNKVVKISYDQRVLKAENLLLDLEDVDPNKKYCGFINSVNSNGVIVEFCNNIRGIVSKNELKANDIELKEDSIGTGFEAYVTNTKKGLSSLSIIAPEFRKKKDAKNKKDSKM